MNDKMTVQSLLCMVFAHFKTRDPWATLFSLETVLSGTKARAKLFVLFR